MKRTDTSNLPDYTKVDQNYAIYTSVSNSSLPEDLLRTHSPMEDLRKER